MTRVDRARSIAVAVCAGVLLHASAARAQSAEAEVLFREGRWLIQAGKLAEGCDKVEASERLESSVGALLNVGDCREKLGQLASAWAAFRKAEAKAKHAGNDEKRRAEARRRAAQVEPRLSYLVLQVEGRPDGLTVRRDGAPVDPALWNTAVPIDPGTYEIVVEAPARRPWRTTVPIDARIRRRVVSVPPLEAAPAAPASASSPGGPAAHTAARSRSPSPSPRRARRTWSTARGLAAALAAAGAGSLGAGAYFGWRARDLDGRSDRRCPFVECDDAEALRLNDRARTAALRANILYAAGGAAAATAAILWFAGKPGDTAIRPGIADGVGVSLAGSF